MVDTSNTSNSTMPQNEREWELWKKAYKEGWNDRGNSPYPAIPYVPPVNPPFNPTIFPAPYRITSGTSIPSAQGEYTLQNESVEVKVGENDGF